MSAFAELALQCERRGWRLCLDGSYPNGRHDAGLVVNNLAVRARDRELLASVFADVDRESLEGAALDCARSLAEQGLIC